MLLNCADLYSKRSMLNKSRSKPGNTSIHVLPEHGVIVVAPAPKFTHLLGPVA